ncbi:MAG: hypothetical protein EOO77_08825 [Oxalobacteraceae bacterium]|nr:MAG: hypothetical protein EOO77_08825 [Oxalobacteraceae bacterium]
MSYDINLKNPDGTTVHFESPHQNGGGTQAVGGTTEAWFNITYNYSTFFYRVLGEKGIRAIYGMTPAESIPVLCRAMADLGTDTDPDYWKATEGNAALALQGLVNIARLGVEQAPDSVWEGD